MRLLTDEQLQEVGITRMGNRATLRTLCKESDLCKFMHASKWFQLKVAKLQPASNLKGWYSEIFPKNFTSSCRYMSTKTTLKIYFPRPFFQEIWAVLKSIFLNVSCVGGPLRVTYMGE